jgi:hypothetical protein
LGAEALGLFVPNTLSAEAGLLDFPGSLGLQHQIKTSLPKGNE